MTRTRKITRRSLLQTSAAAAAVLAFDRALASSGELGFLVVGDWGMTNPTQQAVAAQMGHTAQAIGARLVLTTGDNIYPRGVKSVDDPEWRATFESVYTHPALAIPWHPVLGNHDHKGSVQAQIDYSGVSPRWRMPSEYRSHVEPLAGGQFAEFFMLDTEPIADDYDNWLRPLFVSYADRQLAWLERSLRESRALWKIVIGHHPIHSGGKHGGGEAVTRLVDPLLRRYGVQVYINGHDHSLEHVVRGDVHYLTSGAGARPRPVRPIAGALFGEGRPGFLAARLSPAAMEVEFVDVSGLTLHRSIIPVGA